MKKLKIASFMATIFAFPIHAMDKDHVDYVDVDGDLVSADTETSDASSDNATRLGQRRRGPGSVVVQAKYIPPFRLKLTVDIPIKITSSSTTFHYELYTKSGWFAREVPTTLLFDRESDYYVSLDMCIKQLRNHVRLQDWLKGKPIPDESNETCLENDHFLQRMLYKTPDLFERFLNQSLEENIEEFGTYPDDKYLEDPRSFDNLRISGNFDYATVRLYHFPYTSTFLSDVLDDMDIAAENQFWENDSSEDKVDGSFATPKNETQESCESNYDEDTSSYDEDTSGYDESAIRFANPLMRLLDWRANAWVSVSYPSGLYFKRLDDYLASLDNCIVLTDANKLKEIVQSHRKLQMCVTRKPRVHYDTPLQRMLYASPNRFEKNLKSLVVKRRDHWKKCNSVLTPENFEHPQYHPTEKRFYRAMYIEFLLPILNEMERRAISLSIKSSIR